MRKKLKIGFDIGGVISRYPNEMRRLIDVFLKSRAVEVFIVTDIPHLKAVQLLKANKIPFDKNRVLFADWAKHGDLCKSILLKKHKIDILIDDRPDYIAQDVAIGLLVMPRPKLPYFHKKWKN